MGLRFLSKPGLTGPTGGDGPSRNHVPPDPGRLIHDPTRSAARLVYDVCCEAGIGTPTLIGLVQLTNVGDLWLSKDPDFDVALDTRGWSKSTGSGTCIISSKGIRSVFWIIRCWK